MTTRVLLEVSQLDTNHMQATLGSPAPLLTPPLRFWLPQSISDLPAPLLAPPIYFYLPCSIFGSRSHGWLPNPAPDLALSARELRWESPDPVLADL